MVKKYIIGAGAIVVIGGMFLVFGFGKTTGTIPTFPVTRGNFVISLTENGEVDAKNAVTISAPRIRGNLQIVRLAPEGSMVDSGDFLIQFDPTEQETRLRDAEAEYKIAVAELNRSKAQYDLEIKQLEIDYRKAERESAEKQSEPPLIRKEAELVLELAKLKYEKQKAILQTDIDKLQVEANKAKDQVEQARHDLNKMTITAPIPGLVVYLKIWKGGSVSKVQEGDSPWSGQGLINLPDLSTMIVKAAVSEVDVSKVNLGQKAKINLDAIPGPVFTGAVTDVSTLARKKETGSNINVFDVEIQIDTTDERLKPGMSARAEIIIDQIPDVLSVPLEAVFERDDTTVVYGKDGDPIKVALGEQNDQAVIVSDGLEEGQDVCLVDPHLREEEASEPEPQETVTGEQEKRPRTRQAQAGG